MEETSTGWRERKRELTARRIADAGFRLMLEQGCEATTLDAIAEASGIARRTFFHYFKSKEDVLLAWQDGLADQFRTVLLLQPRDRSPLAAVQQSHRDLMSGVDAGHARSIDSIVRSNEKLRAANQAKHLALEEVTFETLCTMWPRPERRERLRVVAMAATGALRLAFEAWAADDGRRSLEHHLNAIHAALRDELDSA